MEVRPGSALLDSDASLVRRLLADEKAYVMLLEAYSSRLLRFALIFVPDRDLASEIVQETWSRC